MSRIATVVRATAQRLRREAPALATGALASLAAIVVMGLLRVTWGTPTPPELLGDRILPLLNTDLFIKLLITFQPHPKTGPLAMTLLGQFIVGVLLAPLYTRLTGAGAARARLPTWRGWLVAAGFALTMEALALALFWPDLAQGIYGDPPGRARLLTALALLLGFCAYAAVLALGVPCLRLAWQTLGTRDTEATAVAASPTGGGLTRRDALIAAGGGTLLFALGLGALSRIFASYFAHANLAYEGHGTPAPTAAITPPGEFYVVSQNVLDPAVIGGRWQLELTGHLTLPRTWTYDALRALPAETRAITLECISNQVGGNLISNAVWKGVTLDALLAQAGGATPEGRYVIFYGVDGYSTSLPLADLLAAHTLLAWEMNGAPLPGRHGFPLRAIVPGRYGEQSAKWITRIELADAPYKGLYQSQGWSAAPLPTMSRIDFPGKHVAFGPLMVNGIAFGGTRGIVRVEVSTDGGASWHDARLTPPLSAQSWVLWSWPWQPPARGTYTLVVRATDGTGAVQTPTQRGTVPDGATGWHRVKVTLQ
ncbi:MAG: molybdopterin-dependent oxidoreductase [Ktedonobacterales bacterium]